MCHDDLLPSAGCLRLAAVSRRCFSPLFLAAACDQAPVELDAGIIDGGGRSPEVPIIDASTSNRSAG